MDDQAIAEKIAAQWESGSDVRRSIMAHLICAALVVQREKCAKIVALLDQNTSAKGS